MKIIYVVNGVVSAITHFTSNDGTIVATTPTGATKYELDDASPVDIGYTVTVTNGVPSFTAPALPITTIMKAVLWYNCFTPTESTTIKASKDPLVQEFYFRLQQLIAAGEDIDTSLTSIQEGVNYLASLGIVAPARIPAILLGTLQ
jgi:hypothetical protein